MNLGVREYLKLEEGILVSAYSNCEHLHATISGIYFETPKFNFTIHRLHYPPQVSQLK